MLKSRIGIRCRLSPDYRLVNWEQPSFSYNTCEDSLGTQFHFSCICHSAHMPRYLSPMKFTTALTLSPTLWTSGQICRNCGIYICINTLFFPSVLNLEIPRAVRRSGTYVYNRYILGENVYLSSDEVFYRILGPISNEHGHSLERAPGLPWGFHWSETLRGLLPSKELQSTQALVDAPRIAQVLYAFSFDIYLCTASYLE